MFARWWRRFDIWDRQRRAACLDFVAIRIVDGFCAGSGRRTATTATTRWASTFAHADGSIEKVMLIRRSPKTARRATGGRKNAKCVTGKTLAATRLNSRYRRGAGNLTRSRRCWRNGAARALQPPTPPPKPSPSTQGFVAVVPADAKSIAFSPVPRNPVKNCRRVRLLARNGSSPGRGIKRANVGTWAGLPAPALPFA